MSKEEEQRFLILLSSFQFTIMCGIAPTKKEVLDYIADNNWANFSAKHLTTKSNINELVWRNEFAFTRKHLVDNNSLFGHTRNSWEITPSGRNELKMLCNKVFNTTTFSIIANQSIAYARKIYTLI